MHYYIAKPLRHSINEKEEMLALRLLNEKIHPFLASKRGILILVERKPPLQTVYLIRSHRPMPEMVELQEVTEEEFREMINH